MRLPSREEWKHRMLHAVSSPFPRSAGMTEIPLVEERGSADEIDLARLVEAARRQVLLVALCGGIGFVLSVVYILAATPFYTGTANIIIDSRQLRAIKDVSTLTEQPNNPDLEIMDSVVEVLKSEKTARGVSIG